MTASSRQLSPVRSLMSGVAHMLDFTGALSGTGPLPTAGEDIAQAWHDVLSFLPEIPRSEPRWDAFRDQSSDDLSGGRGLDGVADISRTGHDAPGRVQPSHLAPVQQRRFAEETGLLTQVEPSSVPEDVGYRAPAACAAAGITYRQLNYWARTGLVEPSVRSAAGPGSHRLYSFQDILVLRVIKRLLDTGISLQQIRSAIGFLRERGAGDLTQVTLMSDGTSVYACTSPDEVVDLLDGGHGVFGISLGRVWREVEGSLAELQPFSENLTSEVTEPEGPSPADARLGRATGGGVA